MEKGGGSNSESWQRSRSDEAVSWRNKSSTTNDSWSSTYGRGRSPQTSSWRRSSSSSSSSSEDSWRQRQSLNHSDVTGGGATSRAPDLQRGKVVSLNLSQGYGFLAPIVRDMQQNNSNNLYFRLGENSKSQNGLFELQVGDVLEYISNNSKDSPRILYACLVECKMRSLEDLLAYLDILVMHSIENPERVLREITKCPVGLLQVLNYNNPPLYFVRSVVELVRIISEHNKAPLYATRLKTLYKVFSGTAFLQRALREFHSQIEEKRVKSFLMGLATHNPQSVSDTLPLLNDMVKTKGGEELDCHCQFLLSVLTAGNAISSCNLEWNKMRLVPLESEITGSETDETSMETYFKGLPYVKKQGSYGSVEVYMDTYFRLLKEDCFWGLKKGISNLRKNKWDRKDMRIWPNGVAIGLHFGGSHSGVTIAINTERVYGTRRPMEGNLLCLSDDGGNFDSPIWGIVAHCEDSTKKGMVSVFAEIVDGRDGSAEVEIQGFNRLLLASRIVIAECPTFYKAYQPVLKALQGKDLENFPFADELVYTNWPSTPPQYLTPLTTLDWSCLFNKGLTESLFDEGSSDESLQDKLQFPCLLSSVRAPVHELDNLLKCGHRTSLDESQIEAIKLALSNRLVLIQGPPGTGKTYVGVRMLQLLLTADTLPAGPILVMTYKNHGLDNFLMGCLKFCTNLVRVGRRSNEPSLEEYNLYVKLGKTGAFCYDLAEYRDMLNKVQHKMEKAFMKLRESNVFDSETVINHMPDSQIRLLLSKYESDRHLLNSFPEDISLVESTRGRIGGANDTRHLVTLLYKSISKNIREWMPHKKTFELVENCFSLCKPSREICEIRFQRGVKESNYLEEAEQNLSEDESMDEIISGLRISRENESWLEENFLYLRGEDKNNLFSKQVNLHMDIDKYQWLLNENPWQLNEHCRVLLVHVIMQTQYELGLKRLVDLKKEYNEICGMMKEINERQQLQVLQKAAIVGMTSAGAAMYINVLKMLQPSIVFVEEASEVLEPQVLAALEPSVQHLILIGDHCQLSPHVACHELERWHDFSVSMFERLVEHNKFPFQSLAVQSRMREEFLPMILPIYPHVRSNTKLVRGERNQAPACMTTPMHFWDHSFPETRIERSFANPGEAEMVVALLTWMTAEGESPEQITVLAAYNGQVSLLRNKLEKHPSAKDIQVYSIDRFQGSENKIVIVSLVRSNDDGNIGYLAKRNRLCVSVSRAKGALYFCGNHRLFSEKSPHWRTLIDYFKDEECLSEQIQLHCPRHLGDPTVALCNKDASSFDPLLCARPCRAVLDCGHFCSSTCHHGNHPRCEIQVLFKFQSCGHEATKQCSQDQETLLCLKEISYTFDECGHTDVFKCWRVTKKEGLFCMHACPKELECKHPCTLKCYEDCKANPCGICIQIQKEIAAKEKQREIREIELKQEELEKEISKLKSQDVTAELSILELDSETDTAAEYLQVRDRTEKFIQPKHDILPVVTKIEKVRCQKSQIKFLEAQKELISPTSPTQLLFHGTSDQGIQGILEAGFKLPSPNKQNMFGQGIYFATDSSKSAQQIYTKGSNKLLLCEVLLGRTWTVQEAKPEMNKETINKRGYDSLFSKRDGKGKGGTLYDEFVVYDPCQAIPRYIVHYKNLTFHPASAMPSLISTLDCNLTRVEYEMSQTFTGDTPAEYHFRLAESQFFRMSSRNDYKVIKVEHIFNKSLQIRYEKAKEELVREKKSVEEMLVFHGTDKDAIEKIIEEGFKVGGEGVEVRNGSVYGKGVYTALDPNTSISYSKGGMILLSSALIGEKGTDYKEGGSTNVLVLHRTEHLLPKYIVHFIKK